MAGRRQCKARCRAFGGKTCRGFSLVELLVVVCVLGLLAAMIVPWLGAAKRRAVITACGSNLHQIANALTCYAKTNSQLMFPCSAAGTVSHDDLSPLYPRFVSSIETFRCPASKHDYPTKPEHVQYKTSRQPSLGEKAQLSYEYPGECMLTMLREVRPETALLAYDDDGRGVNKHIDEDSHAPDGGNMSFRNGTVEWIEADDWRYKAYNGLWAWYDPPRRWPPE